MPRLPHDHDAEDALLANMLHFPDTIGGIAARIVPGDFTRTIAGAVFAAILQAHSEGQPLDQAALPGVLREAGVEPDSAWLHRLTAVPSGWQRHADTVVNCRLRRELAVIATTAAADASDATTDPHAVLDQLRVKLDAIHVPDGTPPPDLYSLDEFIDRPENEQAPWLIPGLLRRGWRVIVVGGEGGGKSTLWRQFAVLAAQGIHPLGFAKGAPLRTLLVDLENPVDAITQGCIPIRDQARRTVRYEPGRAWIWHRPEGVNLRTRTHQAQLASVLAATRPDVVCLGPVYKCYDRDSRETDEQAVAELQRVFDDLRGRFGFALLLEHHAPQHNDIGRKMRPYGSSLWLRWPEIGIGLEHNAETGATELKRWRHDRMASMWPERIERGQIWPWAGHWDDEGWRTLA